MRKLCSAAAVLLSLGMLLSCSGGEEKSASKRNIDEAVWPVFRGDAALSGVAREGLSDKLSLLWSFQTEGEIISSPVMGFGRVYIGSTDGKVYAVDIASGKKVWAFDTGDDIEASPLLLIDLDMVCIGNLSGEFYAINAHDGSLLWKADVDNSIYGSANWVKKPGSDDICVFVGSYDNMLYCFTAETGELRWTYESNDYINGAPATNGDIVVFGGCDEHLHIVSINDGTKLGEVWAGSYIPGSAAILGDRAYVGHYDSKLVCIDTREQKILWEYQDPEHGDAFFSSPAVGDDVVLIGSRDYYLHCVDRQTGKKVWEFRTRDEIDGSPVIAGSRVLIGSTDGWLYMLDLKTGKSVWSYEIGAAILGGCAVGGGFVVVGAEDGRVYTFVEEQ